MGKVLFFLSQLSETCQDFLDNDLWGFIFKKRQYFFNILTFDYHHPWSLTYSFLSINFKLNQPVEGKNDAPFGKGNKGPDRN